MQIIKRAALTLTFIFALMAMPAAADDVFTEEAIPQGVNQAFLITECGKALVLGVAVFVGPDATLGKLLIAVRPAGATQSEGDVMMNQLLSEVVLQYKADGQIIELADITDRFCA